MTILTCSLKLLQVDLSSILQHEKSHGFWMIDDVKTLLGEHGKMTTAIWLDMTSGCMEVILNQSDDYNWL